MSFTPSTVPIATGPPPGGPTDPVGPTDPTDPGPATQPVLRPPVNLVSPRAVRYWFARAAAVWAILLAVQVVSWRLDWSLPPWHVPLLIVSAVVAVIHVTVMPRWRYRVHRWELTDEAVYTQTGWFTQKRRIAPLSRIQTRRHRAGADRTAVRPVEGDRDDSFGRRAVGDRRAGPRRRGQDRAATHRSRPGGRRGRHMSAPEQILESGADVEPNVEHDDERKAEQEWQRLSVGMLFVQPVRELIRALPFLVALVFAGHASSSQPAWSLIGVAMVVSLGVARWLTTRYRITATAVEVRRGLLARKRLTVPRDRVRTVDVSAHPLQRVLGLVKVEIGTGTSDRKAAALALDGLPAASAATLRAELLHRSRVAAPDTAGAVGTGGRAEAAQPDRELPIVEASWSGSSRAGSVTHRPHCPVR